MEAGERFVEGPGSDEEPQEVQIYHLTRVVPPECAVTVSEGKLSYVEPASAKTVEQQETRLRIAERDLARERARADELFKRMVRVEQVAAHPEFTPGFKEERRRMWNQINLIGVLAGLCLGVLVAVVAVMAVS